MMAKLIPDNLSLLRQKVHACSAMEMDTTVQHYLEYLCQRLNADSVALVIAYRGKYVDEIWKADMLDGWKVMDYISLGGNICVDRAKCEAYFRNARGNRIGAVTQHALSQTGKTRTHRYADVLQGGKSLPDWKSEYLAREGVGDRMIGVYHLDAEAESYVVVDRTSGATRFSPEDEMQLMDSLLEFSRLHYWLFLERGLLIWHDRPCSPKQREIIPLLFSCIPEREIAEKVGVTKGTAHSYIVDIYRNFNVRSRAELVSLWLAPLPISS